MDREEIQKLIERTENTLNGETACWQDKRLYEFIEVTKELLNHIDWVYETYADI